MIEGLIEEIELQNDWESSPDPAAGYLMDKIELTGKSTLILRLDRNKFW